MIKGCLSNSMENSFSQTIFYGSEYSDLVKALLINTPFPFRRQQCKEPCGKSDMHPIFEIIHILFCLKIYNYEVDELQCN